MSTNPTCLLCIIRGGYILITITLYSSNKNILLVDAVCACELLPSILVVGGSLDIQSIILKYNFNSSRHLIVRH